MGQAGMDLLRSYFPSRWHKCLQARGKEDPTWLKSVCLVYTTFIRIIKDLLLTKHFEYMVLWGSCGISRPHHLILRAHNHDEPRSDSGSARIGILGKGLTSQPALGSNKPRWTLPFMRKVLPFELRLQWDRPFYHGLAFQASLCDC